MTTPQAAGSSAPWWVLAANVPDHGPPFKAIQSATRPQDSAVAHVAAGPFSTESAANAWIQQQTGGNVSFPAPPNPFGFLGWLQEAGHYFGILVSSLTDVHMYISLGWLFLGFGLLVFGIVLWLLSTREAQGITSAGLIAGA